jgi:signal peptidase I
MNNLNPKSEKSVYTFLRFAVIFFIITIMVFLSGCTQKTQEFTRGIGVYPGDVNEDFSPELVIENKTYRNLALHRPAFHSSSRIHGWENSFGSK